LVLPEAALREKPKNLSFEEAGSVGVPFITAYEGFRRSGMPQRGQTVAVMGANGKVGHAAVQLAVQAGANVIAVQRGAGLWEGPSKGVHTIVAKTDDVAARIRELSDGKGAHMVFNTVGSVSDSANGNIIAGATVTVLELGMTTVTDQDGNFGLAQVPAGSFTLRTTAPGYLAFDKPFTITDPTTPTVVNITLMVAPPPFP
jgi:NADPH:quinone reductase-like Zn-dependent oxidoreductase